MLLWYTVIIIERSPCNSNSPCAQTLRMEGVSNSIKRVPIQGRSWCVLQIFALSLCSHSKVSSCFYLLNCISSLGFVAGFAGYSLKHSTPVPLKVTFVLAVYMDVKARWYLFSARHYGWFLVTPVQEIYPNSRASWGVRENRSCWQLRSSSGKLFDRRLSHAYKMPCENFRVKSSFCKKINEAQSTFGSHNHTIW